MASVNLDTAENLSITCKQGDTFELTITLKDSAGNGLPLVTDDYKFLMQVRKRGSQRSTSLQTGGLRVPIPNEQNDPKENDSIVIGSSDQGEKGQVNFIFTNKDNNGNVTISVAASEMRRVQSGSYVYDFQYITGSTQKTILEGTFRVNSDISKAL